MMLISVEVRASNVIAKNFSTIAEVISFLKTCNPDARADVSNDNDNCVCEGTVKSCIMSLENEDSFVLDYNKAMSD